MTSTRLLIVDAQVDSHRTVTLSARKHCKVIEFDSRHHHQSNVIDMIRQARNTNQSRFKSIAVVLNGPGEDEDGNDDLWTWTTDLQLDLYSINKALRRFDAMASALTEALTKKSDSAGVDFVAGRLAAVCPRFTERLSATFGVDFHASTFDKMVEGKYVAESYLSLRKFDTNKALGGIVTTTSPSAQSRPVVPKKGRDSQNTSSAAPARRGQQRQACDANAKEAVMANSGLIIHMQQIHHDLAIVSKKLSGVVRDVSALSVEDTGREVGHGRLLVIDAQVSPEGFLARAALLDVLVIEFDSQKDTVTGLVHMLREAHHKNQGPFESIAIAQHGPVLKRFWRWADDLLVDLKDLGSALLDLAPILEVLVAAVAKARKGQAHIDLLACRLHTVCPGLVPALERKYGVDFRASTDDTGNSLHGGDWIMETDNNYDVSVDHLDPCLASAYNKLMNDPFFVEKLNYFKENAEVEAWFQGQKKPALGKEKAMHILFGDVQQNDECKYRNFEVTDILTFKFTGGCHRKEAWEHLVRCRLYVQEVLFNEETTRYEKEKNDKRITTKKTKYVRSWLKKANAGDGQAAAEQAYKADVDDGKAATEKDLKGKAAEKARGDYLGINFEDAGVARESTAVEFSERAKTNGVIRALVSAHLLTSDGQDNIRNVMRNDAQGRKKVGKKKLKDLVKEDDDVLKKYKLNKYQLGIGGSDNLLPKVFDDHGEYIGIRKYTHEFFYKTLFPEDMTITEILNAIQQADAEARRINANEIRLIKNSLKTAKNAANNTEEKGPAVHAKSLEKVEKWQAELYERQKMSKHTHHAEMNVQVNGSPKRMRLELLYDQSTDEIGTVYPAFNQPNQGKINEFKQGDPQDITLDRKGSIWSTLPVDSEEDSE